jgi:hypothetical protein
VVDPRDMFYVAWGFPQLPWVSGDLRASGAAFSEGLKNLDDSLL